MSLIKKTRDILISMDVMMATINVMRTSTSIPKTSIKIKGVILLFSIRLQYCS